MAWNSKALIDFSKALPSLHPSTYDKAMLSTSAALAQRLAAALEEGRISQVRVATECGVTKQAVQGWLRTGRIDKKHLPKLSELTGKPLAWWLSGQEVNADSAPHTPAGAQEELAPYRVQQWPFRSITAAEYYSLSEYQRGMIEGHIKAQIKDASQVKSHANKNAA